MKLELKNVNGYLPHSLILRSFKENDILFNQDVVMNGEFLDYLFTEEIPVENNDIVYRPILRPLSDLMREININGFIFIPKNIFNYNDIEIKLLSENKIDIENVTYGIIQKLYEWHFDIHGLIEKGLAIDVNTLNQ